MFDAGGDKPCEPILEGDWRAWKRVTEFPSGVRGWYGAAWSYSPPVGFEVGKTSVLETDGASLELAHGMVWDGDDDAIVVTEASDEGVKCRGLIRVEEGQIHSDLEPTEPDTFGCQTLHGQRWTVDQSKLPKTTLTNGRATLQIVDGMAKISGSGPAGITCTQRVLRTQDRATTDRGRDDIPVLSGVIVALATAEPGGDVVGCAQAVARLNAAACRRQSGASCDQALVADQDPLKPKCPTHIVIGGPDPQGRRVALLPIFDPVNLACLEIANPFNPTK